MAQLEQRLWQSFRSSFRGPILRAGDAEYDGARKIWNGLRDQLPLAILRCTGVADVTAAIGFARDHGLAAAVRGGGHSIAGHGVCSGGVVIDLSLMHQVHVSPEHRSARAAGGATWGDFDHETQLFSFGAPGGLISSTGVAGLTMGGGMGWLSRKYGMSCDQLQAVEMVTAQGERVRASATENSELFWGARGGGGNFGVVTELEFRLAPVGQVHVGMVMHPVARAPEVLRFYRDWLASTPDELTTVAALQNAPPEPFLPASIHGTPVVAILYCYVGPEADAQRAIAPLRAFGAPPGDFSQTMPYRSWQCFLDGGGPPGRLNEWRSESITGLTDTGIDTLVEHYEKMHSSPFTMILMHHLGGAISRVAEEATAYGCRHAEFAINVAPCWTDPADSARHRDWARACHAAITPWSAGGVYVNFLDEEGDARVAHAYSPAKLARLGALKSKYDPTNFFRLNHNIAPRA